MKLKLFRKRESKEDVLSRDELISAIEAQIDALHEYSTDTLEEIINLESKLKEIDKDSIKFHEQSLVAHKKSNSRLYERALIKLSLNKTQRDEIDEKISLLRQKLKLAINDIKSLEESLKGL